MHCCMSDFDGEYSWLEQVYSLSLRMVCDIYSLESRLSKGGGEGNREPGIQRSRGPAREKRGTGDEASDL